MSTSASLWASLLLTGFVAGCAPAAITTKAPHAERGTEPAHEAPSAIADGRNVPRERAEWQEHFRAERVSGTIALYDSADGSLSCSDVALCGKATVPASTFEIAHSMISLESGILEHAESVLPWDGKHYAVEEWNHDQTLRTAMRVSCVPCFQAIARKVGEKRMGEWLAKLDYGNRNISGGIDQFWLAGALSISPLQQVEFLRRFDQGKLPISKRTADTVQDIITLDVGQTHVLLGKTGLSQPPEFPEIAAWFVGWLELSERRVYFATRINGHEKDVDVKPARRKVTERVLRALRLLPEDATRTG